MFCSSHSNVYINILFNIYLTYYAYNVISFFYTYLRYNIFFLHILLLSSKHLSLFLSLSTIIVSIPFILHLYLINVRTNLIRISKTSLTCPKLDLPNYCTKQVFLIVKSRWGGDKAPTNRHPPTPLPSLRDLINKKKSTSILSV